MSGGVQTSSELPNDLLVKLLTEDILTRSRSQPVYLTSIEVVGGETFSTGFFKKLLSPLIDNSDYTLSQLVDNIEVCHGKLLRTDVFKLVNIGLFTDYANASSSSVKSYNKEKSVPTKVKFDLQSVNLNNGEIFLTFNNDDHLNVNVNYLNNNFNENAELVNVGVSYNPYKPNEHLVSNGKFIANLNNPSLKFLIDIFNTHQNNQIWQQNLEKTSGGSIGLKYINDSKSFSLFNGVSLCKRTIYDINDGAPDYLKFFGGDYLKSSFVSTLIYNNLNFLNKITYNFPISGYNVAVTNEVSLNQEQDNPNNQTLFNRTSGSFNFYKSFWNNNITTHFSQELGLLYTNSKKSTIHISDRFYMGGANSFKGFTRNSVNVNGGLQFYKSAVTVLAKLPSFIYSTHKASATNTLALEDGFAYEANPLRLYATGLVGNVGDNVFSDPVANSVSSVGVGLKYINHWANFDIGYYASKRHDSGDAGIKDGFQFAVSIGGSNNLL